MGWGDELMVTGRARVLQETDPRPVRVVYERPRWHEAWDHNPRIVKPGEATEFQELVARVGYLRPYIKEKFDDQWLWRAHQPPRGELYFTPAELAFGRAHAGRVIVEPHVKAGPGTNKDWGWKRWQAFVDLVQARFGIRVAQLGPRGVPQLAHADWIPTQGMRLAAAVLAASQAAVLPEGGLHHVAAAVGTPAVVIYGGFISPQVTGYADQANLFTGTGLGCGMRHRCLCCRQAMNAIAPEAVAEQLGEILEKRRRSVAA